MLKVFTRWSLVIGLVALIGAAFVPASLTARSASAAPVSCAAWLQPFVDHARQPGTRNLDGTFNVPYVEFILSSNQATNVVGYAERGRLFYQAPTLISPPALTTSAGPFAQPARQYFNDRRASDRPFDPQRADQLGLAINTQTGQFNLQLLSWGGALIKVAPVCENGVMYGFGDTTGVKGLYTISLAKRTYRTQS
jgi:hypothetical protein